MIDGKVIEIEFRTYEYTTSWETKKKLKLTAEQERKIQAVFESARKKVKHILYSEKAGAEP